jgi:hypothetical protein
MTRHQQGFLLVAPYRSFPSPVTTMAGTAALGLYRELRTQPVRNRPRTSRRGQVRHKPVATSSAYAEPPRQAHSPRATSRRKNYYGQGWYFDPAYDEPDGSAIFDSAGGSNSGGYHDPAADALMARLPTGGYQALYAYENYLAQQLPVLWMPQFDFQISAVSNTLRGAYPQDPLTNIYPENWYLVK